VHHVSWRTSLGGSGGVATTFVPAETSPGTLGACRHEWTVTIPLKLGRNAFTVTAVDNGHTHSVKLIVTRSG
jgi:hypothetical protein